MHYDEWRSAQHITEAVDCIAIYTGRGAFQLHRRCVVRHAGAAGKADVGISNEMRVGNPHTE